MTQLEAFGKTKKKCDKVPRYKCNKKCGLGCLGCKTYNIYSKGYQDAKNENKKLEEVLKIIKEKEVDVALFNNCNSVEEYNKGLLEEDYAYDTEAVEPHLLNQSEYDFLKEELK